MQKTLFCVQRHKTVQTDHIILHCILGRTSASCSLLSLNAQVIIPSYFKKSSSFFTFSYVSFVGRGSPSAGAARTAGAGGSPCLLPPQAARPQVGGDEHGAPEYQQNQNQQGAVPEKGLRQEEDDGVGPPVKEPVGLSREKQSMEHHKGPLEVQGRQTAHREKDRRQSGRGPEAGTVPQRGGRDQLFPPAHGNRTARTSAERTSTPRSSRKRARTSAKWAAPSGEAGRTPAAKSGRSPRQ